MGAAETVRVASREVRGPGTKAHDSWFRFSPGDGDRCGGDCLPNDADRLRHLQRNRRCSGFLDGVLDRSGHVSLTCSRDHNPCRIHLAWPGHVFPPHFNGWELVLLGLRTALVGGAFWGLRRCTGYVRGGPTGAEGSAEHGVPRSPQRRLAASGTNGIRFGLSFPSANPQSLRFSSSSNISPTR